MSELQVCDIENPDLNKEMLPAQNRDLSCAGDIFSSWVLVFSKNNKGLHVVVVETSEGLAENTCPLYIFSSPGLGVPVEYMY